jgi:hypothetical protein
MLTDELVQLVEHDDNWLGWWPINRHIVHNHGMRRSSGFVASFAFWLTGDSTGVSGFSWGFGGFIGLAYSREFERDADQYAMEQKAKDRTIRFSDLLLREKTR